MSDFRGFVGEKCAIASGVRAYGDIVFRLLLTALCRALHGDRDIVYLVEQYVTGEYTLHDGKTDKCLPTPSALSAEYAVALRPTPLDVKHAE